VEITELLLQESTRPSKAHGYFESWLLFEPLNDSFKADRCDLFVWSPKVHEQNNLGASYDGLLQLQCGSANSNVVKHPLDFRLVVGSIGKTDGHGTSDLKPSLLAYAVGHFLVVHATPPASRLKGPLFMCLKWEKQSPFGMSFRLNWYEEIR